MTALKLAFVKAYTDRHGRRRCYFRRPGFKVVALPGAPGSAEFMAAYQAALDGAAPTRRQAGAERTVAGSVSALIVAYYGSAEWADLRESTKVGYRNLLERFRAEHGTKPVAGLEARHLRAILAAYADRPGAANNLRKRLRSLLQLAADLGWRDDNPMLAIRRRRGPTGPGFAPWSDDDIARYEAHWPAGTRERLALDLFLYTGQRRSDVAVMGRQHRVGAHKIRVRQIKTGAWVTIPLHPRLEAEIAASADAEQMAFLTTQYGRPFSAAGLTAWFVERAALAGLKDRTPHGLRKAAARRLAEAGCTTHQVASITGHRTLAEVADYTASVEQERLADQAIAQLRRAKPRPTR